LKGFYPERPAYRAVQNVGLAVTEIRYLSLKKQAEALVQGIVDRII
jgi:hypothetical protein